MGDTTKLKKIKYYLSPAAENIDTHNIQAADGNKYLNPDCGVLRYWETHT